MDQVPSVEKEGFAELESFGFPYPPYPVQQELMTRVYDTLEHGGVGIFESPTGTGKTLALLCPALTWLRRRERDLLAEALREDTQCGEVEEAWARDHFRTVARGIADARWHRRARQREERKMRLQRMATITAQGTRDRQRKTPRLSPAPTALPAAGDAEFALDLPPSLPLPEDPPDVESLADQEAFEGKLQIIFCSRTHSQLSQVLQELRRIPQEVLPSGFAAVTLGARSSLCINDSVRARARGNGTHLNDLCRLATAKSSSGPDTRSSCSLKKQAHILADACLADPMDLEAMVRRGRDPIAGGCPYYGSRKAVKEADVLLVPYASLVNAETRSKLGISAKGNVLIFDEAHNLLEAISSSNSMTVTLTQTNATLDALDAYASHYERRLSPGNAVHLKQLRRFCALLQRHLASLQSVSAQTVGAFLVSLGADHFDLPELSNFLSRTELCRKVRGFYESAVVGASGSSGSSGKAQPGAGSAVYGVAELLSAVQGSTASDRILSQPGQASTPSAAGEVASVRYLSLDAEARFRELLASARCVVFAGGTLEPRSEFASLCASLTSGSGSSSSSGFGFGVGLSLSLSSPTESAGKCKDQDKNEDKDEHKEKDRDNGEGKGKGNTSSSICKSISHFTGRHVVPASHIFARYVTHGPGGSALDFRKETRGAAEQMAELQAIVQFAAERVPGGAVFFFPCFEHLGAFSKALGSKVNGREIFVETRSTAEESRDAVTVAGEGLLRSFAAAVHQQGRAVLLAVSGGKLSEGINFKDRLCRLVAVVGLPYPNARDPALLEKMRFLDARRARGEVGPSGRDFYAARCMKAVNQCVGRSIRHASDWAAVLMLDHRYRRDNIQDMVSLWLREQSREAHFREVEGELRRFFATRLGPLQVGICHGGVSSQGGGKDMPGEEQREMLGAGSRLAPTVVVA